MVLSIVRQTKEGISGFMDYSMYVTSPLCEKDVYDIECRIGKRLPSQMRELLLEVGFLNNVIHGDWPQDAEEFIAMQKDIPNDHIAVVGDGAGNYICINDAGGVSFWDHELSILKHKSYNFEYFLQRNLREPENKVIISWRVQLSFDSAFEDEVLVEISKVLGQEINGAWQYSGVSPAGVKSYELHYGDSMNEKCLHRLVYDKWKCNQISVDLSIPITEIKEYQCKFALLSSNPRIGFKLVNYGIGEFGDD